MEFSERDPLLQRQPDLTTNKPDNNINTPIIYTRRWYMVAVFASLACLQSAICLVWLVVAESSEAVFGWSNSDLSLMQIWIYAMYLIGMAPFAWLMQNKGMRISTLVAATLIFMGTLCRMVSSSPPYVTWLAHLGHIFNGLSAPVLFSGSPVISATWFPSGQRATATSIITVYGLSGTALIFLVDPYVVPSPIEPLNRTGIPTIANVEEIRTALMNLRYTEFAIATILLLLTLVYFPPRPPSAPSVSATVNKIAFKTALSQLFSSRKLNFWFVAIPSAISAGLFGVFNSMLDVNLKDVEVTQTTAGWLSFSGTAGASIAGVVLGRLGDKCVGHRKTMLLTMTALATLASLTFVLIVGNYLPFNMVCLFVSYIILAAGVNGALPLYYEACIETTFPVSEGVTMGVITMTYNILPIAFLMVPFIPNIGSECIAATKDAVDPTHNFKRYQTRQEGDNTTTLAVPDKAMQYVEPEASTSFAQAKQPSSAKPHNYSDDLLQNCEDSIIDITDSQNTTWDSELPPCYTGDKEANQFTLTPVDTTSCEVPHKDLPGTDNVSAAVLCHH